MIRGCGEQRGQRGGGRRDWLKGSVHLLEQVCFSNVTSLEQEGRSLAPFLLLTTSAETRMAVPAGRGARICSDFAV